MITKTNSSLESLIEELRGCTTDAGRIAVLRSYPVVEEHFNKAADFWPEADEHEKIVLLSLMATRQAERLFLHVGGKGIAKLIADLIPVERFYASIGGIVGYHHRMLELLSTQNQGRDLSVRYLSPRGIDVSSETPLVWEAIWDGIRYLPQMGEIYPIGGAADRLRLYDEQTGVALPAARLPFLGKTLLQQMITDLQAREYLYYKATGLQTMTPIAMMTSFEKQNDAHIHAICEENGWFGRGEENFRFFSQPSVPTINKEGEWCLQESLELFLKPGGHGVIWRLAHEEGVFDWFFARGRRKALVRQINNPIAGTDYGLLAFTGIGCAGDKTFGFASCPRQVKASEGVNIVIEKEIDKGFSYTLTNIEYCDFKKYGIVDQSEHPKSHYSKFPSNTNILFVDLKSAQDAAERCPIPGILVNLKKVSYRTESGQKKEEEIARLESTMQNIADLFPEYRKEMFSKKGFYTEQTYLTFNERKKTISAVKREFTLGSSLLETPEGCFLDILSNSCDLLRHCGVQIPFASEPSAFFNQGPSFIFLYHPALGPLYAVIAQKIRGGRLSFGSEMQLEIADLEMENLDLEGSLLIHADQIMGHLNADCRLQYSEKVGKCRLKNVKIRNLGIDTEMTNIYWKNEIARKETCHIVLQGQSEFYAENVTLTGDQFIEVPDGFRVTALMEGGICVFKQEKLEGKTWTWAYFPDESGKMRAEISLRS